MGNSCRCLLQVLGKSNVIEIKNVQFSVDFPRMHMGRDIWMLSVKYFKYVPLLHFFEVILHAGGFLWLLVFDTVQDRFWSIYFERQMKIRFVAFRCGGNLIAVAMVSHDPRLI